jgi:hypothetical protein
MFEHVSRVPRRSASGDEAGRHQPFQGSVEVHRGHGGHRGNQLVRKLPSDRGADLRHMLDRAKSVDPFRIPIRQHVAGPERTC